MEPDLFLFQLSVFIYYGWVAPAWSKREVIGITFCRATKIVLLTHSSTSPSKKMHSSSSVDFVTPRIKGSET